MARGKVPVQRRRHTRRARRTERDDTLCWSISRKVWERSTYSARAAARPCTLYPAPLRHGMTMGEMAAESGARSSRRVTCTSCRGLAYVLQGALSTRTTRPITMRSYSYESFAESRIACACACCRHRLRRTCGRGAHGARHRLRPVGAGHQQFESGREHLRHGDGEQRALPAPGSGEHRGESPGAGNRERDEGHVQGRDGRWFADLPESRRVPHWTLRLERSLIFRDCTRRCVAGCWTW